MTISSQIKTVRQEGRLTVTAITTTSTTIVVNINVQPKVQSVKPRPFIAMPIYIPQENQCGSNQRKRKQAEKQDDFIRYR